jgi:VWFA-related protein
MNRVLSICAAMAALAVAAATATQQPPAPPPTAAEQRPLFRGGTHFVRVDAYPIQDGKIVEGLKPEDFEILEDGKPQKVESLDFIRFDTFTPEAARRDPSSQREGFDMAADPRYRVFVIFVDLAFSTEQGPVAEMNDVRRIQEPLVQFLNRVLGPQDLYGFLTSRNSAKDLVLGRKSTVTEAQINDLFRATHIEFDASDQLIGCPQAENLKRQHHADATYTALEGLIGQLGSIRQERKNVVLVTNELPRWKPTPDLMQRSGGQLPRIGTTRGRIGGSDPNSEGPANEALCATELQRLALIDFNGRYAELLREARKENVTFYVITPGGLRAPTVVNESAVKRTTDDLMLLAKETDGLAIVNTNDLGRGMQRIANDLAAYYVLGYYSTNTKWDGGLRTIKVRLTPSNVPVRARRQYRAPTEAEIAALSNSVSPPAASAAPTAREAALVALERASRPFAVYAAMAGKQLTAVVELSASSIQLGRWKQGADVEVVAVREDGSPVTTALGKIQAGSYATVIRVDAGVRPARVTMRLRGEGERETEDWIKLDPQASTLVGDPLVYRAANRITTRPVAVFEFARNERIRVEWPVLATLDRREVRLLDRSGKPLPVEIPLAEDQWTHGAVVEMSLSGLGHGDFLIELTAGAGSVVERRLLAFRLK